MQIIKSARISRQARIARRQLEVLHDTFASLLVTAAVPLPYV